MAPESQAATEYYRLRELKARKLEAYATFSLPMPRSHYEMELVHSIMNRLTTAIVDQSHQKKRLPKQDQR